MTESKNIRNVDRRFHELCLMTDAQVNNVLTQLIPVDDMPRWVLEGGAIHAILVAEFGTESVQAHTVYQTEVIRNKLGVEEKPRTVQWKSTENGTKRNHHRAVERTVEE